MAKINFTADRVNRHACPGGQFTKSGKPVDQAFIWDSKASGLGLRATVAGARTYIFQGKLHGRTVRVTIGDPRDWDIAKAQEEARRLQRLLDKGIDPRADRARKRAEFDAEQRELRRMSTTVGTAWADYILYLESTPSPKTRKPRSAKYIADHVLYAAAGGAPKRGGGKTVAGPLAPLMDIPLGELSADRVRALLEAETAIRPTSMAYAYRMLKAFARWCEGQDEYSGSVVADCYTSSKVTSVLPNVGVKEGDCLQREQLQAWFSAVRGLDNPVLATYLQGLLITGARREELAALRWDDVDLKWRSMRIADKIETETGRVIPLSPYLASLLLELKRINETPPNVRQLRALKSKGEEWKPSEWVFASKTAADGKINSPRFAHGRALQTAGLPHITLHGLRRSFGTLSEWCEVPVGVVAQIQGHKPSAVAEKHYRRRPLDMLRLWHDRIEAWMLQEARVVFVTDSDTKGKVWPTGT
ncbi:integrase family protein [Paraburkholderia sp. Ac-20342]|uniref:tyrosine-type recombinase/integrase n=1 Tax=Paraburkholderia sp. Ac-20342 TaxID=2703889 RepID=UPI00197E17F6